MKSIEEIGLQVRQRCGRPHMTLHFCRCGGCVVCDRCCACCNRCGCRCLHTQLHLLPLPLLLLPAHAAAAVAILLLHRPTWLVSQIICFTRPLHTGADRCAGG